jgi:4-amino-4-deoxy-L-arabinose transferase-like glycosyltransferase
MTAPTTHPATTRSAASVLPVVAAVAGWLLIVLVSVGRIRDELEATLHRDEAIAWTYASLPLDAIPGALSYDVNPPVYFVALHTWLSGGAGGETFLRALSVLAILAAAAVAFDAARRVADTRAGWLASIFVLLAPSTLALAGLARPYALAFLLGTIALDAAIVMVKGGGVVPVVVLGVAGGLLPLTHYWGGLLLVAIMLGLAVTALRTGRRTLLTRALLATGIAVLAAVPWLATLWVQLGSTPLAAHSNPTGQLLGETLTKAAGGQATAWVLGLVAALAVGAAVLAWRRTGRRPALPSSLHDPAHVFLAAVSVAALGAVLVLWGVSQVRPLFSPNYAFLVLAPLPILVGVVMSRRAVTFVAVLGALLVVSLPDLSYSAFASDTERESRGPEYDIARMLDYSTQTGDVVFTSPGRTLAVRYYLGTDRQYRTAIGGVSRGLFDYRDRVTRLRATDPRQIADSLAQQPAGTRIAFVHDAGAPLPQRYWMELDRVMDRISWYLRDDERLELVFNGELPDPYGATFVDVFEVTRR